MKWSDQRSCDSPSSAYRVSALGSEAHPVVRRTFFFFEENKEQWTKMTQWAEEGPSKQTMNESQQDQEEKTGREKTWKRLGEGRSVAAAAASWVWGWEWWRLGVGPAVEIRSHEEPLTMQSGASKGRPGMEETGMQRRREDRSNTVWHGGFGDAGTRVGFTGVGPVSHTGSGRLLLWLNSLLSSLKILGFNKMLLALLWASWVMQVIPARNC